MSYKEIEVSNYLDIVNEFHVHSLLAKIITTFNYSKQEIASFFRPIDSYQFDKEVLEKSASFLKRIASEKKKVFIFGDYDCDGITATTIMLKLLEKLGIHAGYYLPSRISEGYGLNINRLIQAKEKGYSVLITVDNGVSAFDEIKWAKENGFETFVSDHHIITQIPQFDCFLHPSLLSEPYHYLCGASLVYCLAEYMNLADDSMRIMAMIATLSDVMNLKGINIKIVQDGLNLFNQHKYKNVEMLDMFDYPCDENDISFKIIPKINAVGRMSEKEISDVNKVVKFFKSEDVFEIKDIKENIIVASNEERKRVSDSQYLLLKSQIDEKAKYNFLCQQNLHVGILGLLASRIESETNKVTIVLTKKDDKYIGSIRSVDNIDIMQILEEFIPETLNCGGHAGAAGISICLDKLNDLKEFFDKKFADLPNDTIIDVLKVDSNDLTLENVKEVFQNKPYGQGRKLPKMMFELPNVDMSMLRTDYQLKWNYNGLEFISFSNKGFNYYKDKESLKVVGTLKENKFRGRITYQFVINSIIDEEN